MLSRALSLATVTLLIGFAAVPARAQNLEAGKSPSQIFAGGCAVCHKSPRGLLKTVAPGSLPGFLRQHYTTSPEMASSLSAYVISNGASDTRMGGGGLTRQGRDLTTEQKPLPQAPGAPPAAAPADDGGLFGFMRRKREPAPEAARPDVPPAEPTARGRRNAKRQARPAVENPDAAKPAVEGQPPVAAESEPVAPRQQKQKLSKKRRDREEAPKTDAVKDEPKSEPKTEPRVEPKSEPVRAEPAKPEPRPEPAKPAPAREETSKPAAAKPVDEPKPEAARPEPAHSEPKPEAPPLRADPVPPVTPAPKAAEPESRPAVEAPAPTPATPASP